MLCVTIFERADDLIEDRPGDMQAHLPIVGLRLQFGLEGQSFRLPALYVGLCRLQSLAQIDVDVVLLVDTRFSPAIIISGSVMSPPTGH